MHFQGYTEDNWDPVEMLNLKEFKEALVSYGMFHLFWNSFKFMDNLELNYSIRLERLCYRNIIIWSSVTMGNMKKRRSELGSKYNEVGLGI